MITFPATMLLALTLGLGGPAPATAPAFALAPASGGLNIGPAVNPISPQATSQPAPEASPPAAPVKPRPHMFTAAAEVAGLNFGVWAFLHYVANSEYSYISSETMLDNLRDGWEWDRSRYFINFYHHPYHGYLYYSAGRANGLNYWASSVSALAGSFMWEMMMEDYRPSINDLITTTCGGIVYGEIGYRFSALVRKKNARGLGWVWREAVGTILDPVGGANRLFNGRRDSDPGLPGSPDAGRILNGELVVTGPVVARSAELTGTKAAPLLGFTLRYGDEAGTGWTGRPFDVFTVAGRLRWGPDRPHLSLFIHGALFGRAATGRAGRSHFVGLYQHYEYYGLDTMRVSGTSFTAGWSSRFTFRPKGRVEASARLGWLGLGASDDFLFEPGERRSYNLATGLTAAADARLALRDFEYVSLAWRHYNLFDLNVIGSRVGRETWDILQGQLELPVGAGFGAGIAAEFCSRRFHFRDFPSGHRDLFETRAFVSWQF